MRARRDPSRRETSGWTTAATDDPRVLVVHLLRSAALVAEVQHWLEFSVEARARAADAILAALNAAVADRTFLVGSTFSVADVAVAAALQDVGASVDATAVPHAARWFHMTLARLPASSASAAGAGASPVPTPSASVAAAESSSKKGKGAVAAGTAASPAPAAPATASGEGAAEKKGEKKGKEGKEGAGEKKGPPAEGGKKGKGGGSGGAVAEGGAGGGAAGGGGADAGKIGELPALVGAKEGEVVTRFPPEPSGYLHIGHVKAVMLNAEYARLYKGRLLVRFDDTNPAKEKDEFEQSIIEDLNRLGVKPDQVSHTSDFFPEIADIARKMIRDGFAYMDDTPVEEMRKQRLELTESKHRSATPEENLARFELMFSGADPSWCMRAKIDMKSANGCMRDPVMFRSNEMPHHRTGTRYKAYPTYDFACPIVDAIEGVTHALRTTEYNDRAEQYEWIQRTLGLRHVEIQEFSRVNFQYTVLSKRKLTWFVNSGIVDGWNDARFPTVQGILRRGVRVESLREFILAGGASRRIMDLEWDKFWAMNKKFVDPIAHRYFAIDHTSAVRLTLRNGPASPEGMSVQLHPKDESLGFKIMLRSSELRIEGDDAKDLAVEEEITLMRWGNIIVKAVHKDAEGNVVHVEADVNAAGDPRTTKKKITWIADTPEATKAELVEFDYLVTKGKLEEEEKIEDFVNPHSRATTYALGEAALRSVREDQVIQLERRGFFRCDRPYISEARPIVLYAIPDGKVKAMSTLSRKITMADQKDVADRIARGVGPYSAAKKDT